MCIRDRHCRTYNAAHVVERVQIRGVLIVRQLLQQACDVFVNDAFGTAHRAHCSNVGVAQLVDTAVVGYLMQKEIDFLGNAVENPVRPFVAILGGAKVADKLNVISNLLEKCDTLIIGGGIDRKSTRLNSSHSRASRMPSSA